MSADNDKDPEALILEKGLLCVSDESQLMELVTETTSQNPKAAQDYRNGKEPALMFLVGQVMRKTKGKANPNVLKGLFEKVIKSS